MNRNDLIWKFMYLVAAGGIYLIDQASKAWAIRKLRFGGDWTVIDGFLNMAYAENTGVAFSMFDDHGVTGRWALSGIALVAGFAVIYYFWKVPKTHDRLLSALALLLAGIAGNVTDRLRFGFVIDFIQFHYKDWYYPTFNVADMAICFGAGLLIIDMLFSKKTKPVAEQTVEAKG